MSVVGQEGSGTPELVVNPDSLRSFKVYVTVPSAGLRGDTMPLVFEATDPSTGVLARHETTFRGPK